jgi:hypothetical protein
VMLVKAVRLSRVRIEFPFAPSSAKVEELSARGS